MATFEQDLPSTRPYLIRALHEWCVDNGFSPYLAVYVDATVRVPMEFVKNGEIVLNVSPDATSALRLGDEYVEFKARFGGVAREIIVPITHVIAIYARENGQGMAFPAPVLGSAAPGDTSELSPASASTPTDPAAPRMAGLRSVPQQQAADPGGVAATDESGDVPPDGPPRGGGKRPQLKRVK
jgi:stringent starvation protein B